MPLIILAIGGALGFTMFGKEAGESVGDSVSTVIPFVALGALVYFVLRK